MLLHPQLSAVTAGPGPGHLSASASHFQFFKSLQLPTAASRTRPWLASGWGCRGRQPFMAPASREHRFPGCRRRGAEAANRRVPGPTSNRSYPSGGSFSNLSRVPAFGREGVLASRTFVPADARSKYIPRFSTKAGKRRLSLRFLPTFGRRDRTA